MQKGKLQKKARNVERDLFSEGGQHTKEYCHYAGIKTWMKDRHFKKAAPRYQELPVYDMDGSPFVSTAGNYPYINRR